MANVLSIDWDCFFVGADEVDALCGSCSWSCTGRENDDATRPRVGAAVTFGYDFDHVEANSWLKDPDALPQLSVRGFPRVTDAALSVAECHADVWSTLQPGDAVFNFDAHNDYNEPGLTEQQERQERKTRKPHSLHCGSWAYYAEKLKRCRYKWLYGDHRLKGNRRFHKIFVCQSRPWTPRGYDGRFYRFLVQLQQKTGGSVEFVGSHRQRLRAGYRRAQDR